MKEIGRSEWRVICGITVIYKCPTSHLFIWYEDTNTSTLFKPRWIKL